MANIDRDNRYFYLRLFGLPFSLFRYFFKLFKLKRISKNYVVGASDDSEESRYTKFLALYKSQLFRKKLEYSFVFKKKIAKQQIIFVVNDILDWYSIGLMNYIVKYQEHPYPKFLLNDLFIDKKKDNNLPVFWDFIDTFYGESDLDRALSNKRSLFIERSFLARHPNSMEKIKASHISIMPIYCLRQMDNDRIWYFSGELIKTSNLVLFKSCALLETIDNAFLKLEKEAQNVVTNRKNQKKK
ncbi:hypothetical protein [Candidatus Mycoplasma haematohominis]|uniref:Uncharacterized protein n=1 Tax=Candidatus Mycoplasma haematohominis TaxID=1494318 RepID=A0A478FTU4_9MOLU|nr:hypothetical protein [Candidatus Mycoplasma haemohominis]GCE63766.1 hypothetical protein MHSWG343_07670 [Candidatus Mycoplasma haemohominis]